MKVVKVCFLAVAIVFLIAAIGFYVVWGYAQILYVQEVPYLLETANFLLMASLAAGIISNSAR